MDARPPPFCLDGRANAMEHLMIHHIGDKVRGKFGPVHESVDLDQLLIEAIEPQLAVPPGLSAGAAKPGDLEFELTVKIVRIDRVVYGL